MAFNFYCGCYQGENSKKKYYSASGTQGNGKTMCVVKQCVHAWLNGAWVFTNFKTIVPGINKPFSYVMNLHDMIVFLRERQKYIIQNDIQVAIGLMEMWSIISYFNDPAQQAFYGEFTNQLRKFNIDLYGDSQRSMGLPPGLRDNVNNTFLPSKTHDNGDICRDPKCKRHHTIEVREVLFDERNKPYFHLCDTFDAAKYGLFYNSFSNEIIHEPGLDTGDE